MRTTCYLCGLTDGTDLSEWGQSPDLGWYHLACARAERERLL